MTPDDIIKMARLRKLQRLGNISLNALVSRIGDTSDIRPSAEQWAGLVQALEAANIIAQELADQLAAAHMTAKARGDRGAETRVAGKTKAP